MAEHNESRKILDADFESSSTVYLMPHGYKKLHDELEYLTTVKRPEIADRIRDSFQHGEFSEDNSELDEVKFDQAMVENRIQELKVIFGNAVQINEEDIPTDFVGLGSFVALRDEDFGDDFDVRIVSIYEADPNESLISNESPLGIALVGAKVGDKVTVDAPDGKRLYSVRGITR